MLRTSKINTWEVVRDCQRRRGCGSIRAIFTICLWTSDIGIPRKLFRNAEPQVLPQTISNFLDDSYTHESVGSVAFENSLLALRIPHFMTIWQYIIFSWRWNLIPNIK